MAIQKSKKPIFIGVAWPYVNGELHIGHLAGYLLPADIFARFNRLIGNDVLMVSGSDCYGTPITVEADKRGVSPQQIIDEYHPKHKKLFELYGLFQDNDTELFTKTTTENHKKVVQDMFIKMAQNGYIIKDATEQYYSPSENKFLPDRYVEGECPHCGYFDARGDQCDKCGSVLEAGQLKNPHTKLGKRAVELKKTEHYFIDWKKLQKDFLERYTAGKSTKWREWVYKETMGWLNKGLEQRAITRDLNWGIEIPVKQLEAAKGKKFIIDNIENKRIYVWFEAVIGYLSASQEWAQQLKKPEAWKNWWYNKAAQQYYFMGKDNLIFHTLFWPGQLWGAYGDNINKPDVLPINHYLTLEGHKFSKSRNIIIDSAYIGQQYGVDAVRFYLTWIMPENSDANFSWDDFVDTVNNVLIGDITNFIHRVLTLIQKFGVAQEGEDIKGTIQQQYDEIKRYLIQCEFKLYTHELRALAAWGNKYLNDNAPWSSEKSEKERKKILANALLIVLALQLLINPLMPETSKKLSQLTGVDSEEWQDEFVELLQLLLKKVTATSPTHLFKKIQNPEEITALERAKLSIPQ